MTTDYCVFSGKSQMKCVSVSLAASGEVLAATAGVAYAVYGYTISTIVAGTVTISHTTTIDATTRVGVFKGANGGVVSVMLPFPVVPSALAGNIYATIATSTDAQICVWYTEGKL